MQEVFANALFPKLSRSQWIIRVALLILSKKTNIQR